MHPNSIDALIAFEVNGTLSSRKTKIILLLTRLNKPLTRKDLAGILGCESSGVTYPVKMLIDTGYLIELYTGINKSTGYRAAFLGLVEWDEKKEPPLGQLSLKLFTEVTSNYPKVQR